MRIFPCRFIVTSTGKTTFFSPAPQKHEALVLFSVISLINLLDDLISYACDLGVKNHRRLREKIDVNNGRQFGCDLAVVLCVIPYSAPSMLILRVGIKREEEGGRAKSKRFSFLYSSAGD